MQESHGKLFDMYGSLPSTLKRLEGNFVVTYCDGKRPRKARLEARLTPEQKKHIEHAARIRGTSISDFVGLSADDAAVRTIREREVLSLNEHAREVFANALLHRPVPGARLLAGAKRYKRRART
jgi:uncharacterized protein (DUF1778 family)